MVNVLLFKAQPFHKGHLANIRKALHDAIINDTTVHIFIGSADKEYTKRNPLPIGLRVKLVTETIQTEFSRDLDRIFIHTLDDLDDEANNTHSWGSYLFNKIVDETGDTQIVFYYSDKPEIMLSWFSPDLRDCVYFKFLPRVADICATNVRWAIKNNETKLVKHWLPETVYNHLDEIRKYIK